MKLSILFTEISHHDPYAKYWNPAEKAIEQQKTAEKQDEEWLGSNMAQTKEVEQQANDVERQLVKQGMNPDAWPLSRANKEPFETKQFKFQNGLYSVKAYDIDTYDGPETRVEFYTPAGKMCDVQQEAASVDSIIQMWMEVGNHGPVRRRDETKF